MAGKRKASIGRDASSTYLQLPCLWTSCNRVLLFLGDGRQSKIEPAQEFEGGADAPIEPFIIGGKREHDRNQAFQLYVATNVCTNACVESTT